MREVRRLRAANAPGDIDCLLPRAGNTADVGGLIAGDSAARLPGMPRVACAQGAGGCAPAPAACAGHRSLRWASPLATALITLATVMTSRGLEWRARLRATAG